MTLRELLDRKAVDYGYGSIAGMAKAWGVHRQRLYNLTNGRNGLSLEMRQRMIRELDIAPAVMEEVAVK